MRIGIGGLSCECSTFSPRATGQEDFTVLTGDPLLEQYGFQADYPEAEFIPLLWARALPGGRIERPFFDDFLQRLVGEMEEKGPFDGLLLPMHGASSVFGLEDAEAHFFSVIREVVGPGCRISASYDLHGNLSSSVMRSLDLLTAYRTAPHEDCYETVERACRILVRCVHQKKAPVKAHIRVPILLPGEQTGTGWEPASGLYGMIPSVIEEYGLLDASILVGYVWADEPRASASVVALGPDHDRTWAAAKTLAQRFWDLRHGFRFGVHAGPLDLCFERAVAEPGQPVLISDSGDNPTAGGAGDIPFVLEKMLNPGLENALCAGIADPVAVTACEQAGIGEDVELQLGGKLDPVNGSPLRVMGRVVSLHDTVLETSSSRNRVAVVQSGGVRVIITELRTPFHHREQFQELGLVPEDFKIVVVKMGYLVPELQQMAVASLLALTPGAVNQDITSLPFRNLNRPLYPFDPNMQWSGDSYLKK